MAPESGNTVAARTWHKDILNSWTPTNTGTDIPRFQYNDQYTAASTTRFMTSARYLNFQSFSVGYTLPRDLTRKAKIEKLRWIRVLYCYPERVTDELIDVMANEEKIVKYIDLPLQHCNAEILKSMNRRGSRESLTALLNKIRDRIPNVVLRTTFISGFPGED